MAAEDEIAGDAETPPPPDTDQDEDKIPPRSPSLTAGPSGAESPDSPPPGPAGFKKRKQVRHLFSSSDEDDEDMKNIKRRGKKRKVETGKQQQRLRAVNVKCRVKHLNPPPLSVGARLDEAGEVISWRIVSSQQYRRTCRLWAGLDREGRARSLRFYCLIPSGHYKRRIIIITATSLITMGTLPSLQYSDNVNLIVWTFPSR